jgi:hypothetical protein
MDLLSKRSWRRQLLIVLAIMAWFAEIPLAASPIHLRCVVTDGYLVHDYGGELAKVQKDLCESLKSRLDGKALLLAWEYVPFDRPGAIPKPALVLVLSNEGQTRRLTLRLERKDYPPEVWAGIWKEPGDTFPDPLAGNAGRFFADKTKEMILDPIEQKINENLRPIAIATANWSSAGAPKVVTSLPWRGNEVLRASRFRLVCQPESQALESLALVPDDGPLSLEAKYWLPDRKSVKDILPQVKRLTPKLLFLLDFQVPDETETFAN